MEGWCDIVSKYPNSPEPKHLAKALRAADSLFVADLAPFEIEWLTETLLFKPVDAIKIIKSKKDLEDWIKNIADVFKVISKIASKCWTYIENESDILVQVCLLPFVPQIRKEAIHCLISILKNPGVDVGDAVGLINALESETTCRAPLALLVGMMLPGSVCRYYPESVDQNYERIWRIYLNMLQSPNKTDTLVNAVLQGIDGLLENFGRDIAIQELQHFYKDFSRKCAKIGKCIEPLLSILKSHAALFREKLVEDKVLRLYLWGINSPNIKDALLAVYTVIFSDVPPERIKEMIRSEIQPNTWTETSLVKHTAFRIMVYAKIHHHVTADIPRPDHLEFQLRHRPISYEEADLVSLCLASQESYVKSLLMSTIMYYDHIPATLRQDMVVKGILQASKDARKMALTLLVELSQQDGCLHKYADIWRTILDVEDQGDGVLRETIQHLVSLLKSNVEALVKDVDEVSSLSNVLCFLLSVSETDDTSQYTEEINAVIVEIAAILCVCPSEILSSKYLCIEMFKPKSILKDLMANFKENIKESTLFSVQLLFNQEAVDPKLLIKGLSEMDNLLKTDENLDERQVGEIIKKIVKLQTKNYKSTCDDKVLRRDLAMFLGEHGKLIEKEDFSKELYSLELKNKIILNVPNINEGINYKLDLLRILQISLEWEDYETLYCLLVVISANLRDRPDPSLQFVTWRCIHALFRTNGSVDVKSAVRMCVTKKCMQEAIYSIQEESSPEVRKKLCECVEVMLLHDPGSEDTGQLMTLVAEEIVHMIEDPKVSTYVKGIDLAKVFLSTLHDNDNLTVQYLPKILIKTSRKIVKDFYKTSTDSFMEKLDIFEEDVIKETVSGIAMAMIQNTNSIQIELILEFLKRIFDAKTFNNECIINDVLKAMDTLGDINNTTGNIVDLEAFSNVLQILAMAKSIFSFDGDTSRAVVNNASVNIGLITSEINGYIDTNVFRNILKFVNEYAVELLEIKGSETITCFGKLIESIPPESVAILKNDLSVCLSTLKNIQKGFPEEIVYSFIKWFHKLNINEINTSLSNPDNIFAVSDALSLYSDRVRSLSVMSKLFDSRISDTAAWTSLLVIHGKHLRPGIVSDMLSVSEKSLTLTEFGEMLQEHPNFVQRHLDVYFVKYMQSESVVGELVYLPLFMDAVKIFVDNYRKYERFYDAVVRIFDKIWPMSDTMGFKKQLSVATDLFRLPRDRAVPTLVQWVKDTIIADTTSLDHKIRLIIILPGGEEYSSCYRCLAGCLPIHLSEVKGEHSAVLRSLLDALASTGDLTLLDIITTIAAADETKGWWDDAIEACMASLADRQDQRIFDAAYGACKRRTGLGGCQRVFVPLLKHSTRKFCEEYMCGIIVEVLDTLRTGYREASNSEVYREKLMSYAKSFSILHVAIDKVPAKNLESGIINISAGYQAPWRVVKDVCMYSMMLRNKVQRPDDATEAIKDAYLRVQCSAYKCLAAAICKMRPSQKQYASVFDVAVWSKVVDPEAQYEFPPRAFWGQNRRKRSSDTSTASTSSSFTGTVRTRMFMATLSENPLEYDMIPNYEDNEDMEEDRTEPYESHPLNCLGVLSAITELLVHASTLTHTDWLATVNAGLSSLHVNAKWTLAQAICNAESDLKPHASALVPTLLAVVASTPNIVCDRRVLNNLHIEILWTILRWEIELSSNDDLNSCIEYLISSCVEYRSRDAVVRRLLTTLNNLLQMYKDIIDIRWSFLEIYCDDLPTNASYLLPVLQRILRNGVRLPGLLNIYNRFEARHWMSISKLAEVFGLALSLEGNRKLYMSKFCQVLDSVKTTSVGAFVKILLYVQRQCWQCCSLRYIRMIADLATKVEKSKCLTIICIYLENLAEDDGFCREMLHIIGLKELLDGDLVVEAMKVFQAGLRFMEPDMKSETLDIIISNCSNSLAKIRKQAFSVVLKVFQDIMMTKDGHSAKRRAVDSTPILESLTSQNHHKELMEVLSGGVFDDDVDISSMVADGLEECLSKEMTFRFAELFYIVFYLSKNDFHQLSEYGYVFLDLLFRDMKRQEGFQNKTLSDQPLPSDTDMIHADKNIVSSRNIDVEMPVADIFEVFLQSAKNNSRVCQELLVELMKRFQGAGRRFDFDAVMAMLLGDLLKKEPNCLTPLCIEASRIFLNNVASVDGFKDTVKVLRSKVIGSDAAVFINILYEDLLLRTDGRSLFNFGINEEFDVKMRNDNDRFSIEGLTEVFGNLSNWDDLRIQDRNRIEECLPPLLVPEEEFESSLKEYFDGSQPLDYSLWFNKMVGAYCSNKLGKPMVQYKEYWLRDSGRWPAREFITSAVIEAMKWSPNNDELVSCEIKRPDCLAEWAARLMLRSSYFGDDALKSVMCRGDELKWCSEANRRRLPKLALQCIERNKRSLLEDEALSWFHEKVVAHRTIALRKNDTGMLRQALDAAERQNVEANVYLQKLILQLRSDLGTLSMDKLDEVLASIKNSRSTSQSNLDTLKSIYDLAMNYYDDLWEADDTCTKVDIISKMVDIIRMKLEHNIMNDYNLLIAVLLSKLSSFEGTLSEVVAKKVLDLIDSMVPHLDTYSMEVLKGITNVFPSDVASRYSDVSGDDSLQVCKEHLEMVRDPQYALLQYCSSLFYAKDLASYKTIFSDMKRSLFGNTFGSTDYRSLNTMKNKLFGVEHVDNIVARNRVLISIMDELKSKPQRSVLRLSQLAPELSKPSVLEKQKANLQKLLALPPSVHVVKFLEQIQVFRDSIRRPCVLSAVLSTGVTKRYIIKSGEPLANDASVQRALAILPKMSGAEVRSYNVTILAEDVAIIEYLEDHERLRELMGDAVNVPVNQRLADDKLVLSPSLALQQYHELCSKVPVYALRSAIENRCASVQEFIFKKHTFLSTLCSMTITNWLFGVGDRHLHNIMMNRKDGGVCGVDWATSFQYGLRECVPARLTPCLLAVCDITVLENRLQSMLLCLRENRRLYEAFIKISFYWQEQDFKPMTYIRNILNGTMVSYEITKNALEESNVKPKEDYFRVLDAVFEDFKNKNTYSVEEQVSCLLKHCTDVKLLSITPQGWEGWL